MMHPSEGNGGIVLPIGGHVGKKHSDNTVFFTYLHGRLEPLLRDAQLWRCKKVVVVVVVVVVMVVVVVVVMVAVLGRERNRERRGRS